MSPRLAAVLTVEPNSLDDVLDSFGLALRAAAKSPRTVAIYVGGRWTYGDGRAVLDPAPVIPGAPDPAPHDEDGERAAETGKSAEYWASMRTVRNVSDWDATRAAEAARDAKR